MTAPVRAPAAPGALRASTAAAPGAAGRVGADTPNPRIATDLPTAQPALRLVDARRLQLARRRRRARLALIAGGALVVALLFGVVFGHAMLVSGQGRLDELQRAVAEEQNRYQALRLEVARLESPDRIVAEAKDRLGMVEPLAVTYLAPVPFEPAVPLQDDGAAPGGETGSTAWARVKPLLSGRTP